MTDVFCNYTTGMFGHEPRVESPLAHFLELQVVAHHEAGHAVVGYALGLGCTNVSLMSTVRGDGIAYHGEAHQRRDAVQRVNLRMKAGLPRASCAGDIQRRGRRSALMGTGKDHESISNIAKRLEWIGGRNRDAFRRLVWRQAQLALEDESIWRAVGALAEALTDLWPDDGGDNVATIPGATAPNPTAPRPKRALSWSIARMRRVERASSGRLKKPPCTRSAATKSRKVTPAFL